MIAEETFRRYTANWVPLALAGLFALLVNLVVGFVSKLILAQMLGAAGLSLMLGGDSIPALLGGAWLGLLLVAVATALVAPIGMGGLMHGVVQVQRGRPAGLSELWQAGLRNWQRLLVLNVIAFLVLLPLGLLFLILRLIPVLGIVAWGIGTALIMFALSFYGPYIAVSRQVSGVEAAGRAFRILTAKFGDLFLTLLVALAAGLVVGILSALLELIPGVRSLVPYASQIFLTPLGMLYLAIRYERNIAPSLEPPGGAGHFDPGPPPGA